MFGQLPSFAQTLLQNGIVTGSITAVLLNIILSRKGEMFDNAEEDESTSGMASDAGDSTQIKTGISSQTT